MEKDRRFLHELNVLKGLAIVSVVMVHICDTYQYTSIKHLMHAFQSFMYLFMFASGFLFKYSGQKFSTFSEYRSLIKKKSKQLLVPYFTVSLIILAVKFFSAFFSELKNPVTHTVWKDILFTPMGGFATHLWFIYVLFIIFLIFPLALKVIKNRFWLFIAVLIVYFAHVPFSFFELHLVRFYLIFFCIGYLYASLNFKDINNRAGILCLISWISLVLLYTGRQHFYHGLDFQLSYYDTGRVYFLIQGISCIFSFYYLSVVIERKQIHLFNLFNYFGKYSFAIYLLHTIFMGIVCFVLDRRVELTKGYHSVMILVFSGIVFPVMSTKYIINKSDTLSMLILGRKHKM